MRKIAVLASIVILLSIINICATYYHPNNPHQTKTLVSPTAPNVPTGSPTPLLPAQLPKIGYRYTVIKMPDTGTIFISDIAGRGRQALSKLDADVPSQPHEQNVFYSQAKQEIIAFTSTQILGINVNTGKQRILYDYPGIWASISDDGNHIYFTRVSDMKFSEPSQQYTLNLNTLIASPVTTCGHDYQPYSNTQQQVKIDIRRQDTYRIPPDTMYSGMQIAKSNKVTVCQAGKPNKSYIFNQEEGDIDPLILTDNFLYFRVTHCCVGTSQIEKLYQMDLKTGVFSDATSLPELNSLVKTNFVETYGWANHGSDYIFRTHDSFYRYNSSTGTISQFESVPNMSQWSQTDSIFIQDDYSEYDTYRVFNLRSGEYVTVPRYPGGVGNPVLIQ